MNMPTRATSNGEKIISIIGGVGPEAGTLLHRFVIEETSNQKRVERDQDHLFIYHVSVSPWITDRTNYLLGEHDQNSAIGASKVVEVLSNIAKSLKMKCVVGVPCNTFHAKPIFKEFLNLVDKHSVENVEILNMVEETRNYIEQKFDNVSKIGLMSTTGTREHRIYHTLLESLGYVMIEVDAWRQDNLHNCIYNSAWGIKSVTPTTDKAKSNFQNFAKQLIRKGAEVIILGCTEIPLALPGNNFKGITIVDPMRVLAKALVKKAVG